MKQPLILTFDVGTQSVRALLFDQHGTLLGLEQVEFHNYIDSQDGFIEQDPRMYYDKMAQASHALKAKNNSLWDHIAGITLTTMRDTFVSLDAHLQVLRPTILWMDPRLAQCKKPMPLWNRFCFGVVGMSRALDSARRKSKANWLAEEQSELWAKTEKYVFLSTYFTYLMTGTLVDSVSNQVGHLPFDYRRQKWMRKSNLRYPIFGVDLAQLYDLVPSGSPLGTISEEAAAHLGIKAGTPFIASGSDKGCESLGTGCLSSEKANLSFGTQATIQVTSPRYFEPVRFMPAYPSVYPGRFNPEISIYRGFWMVRWFKEQFGTHELEAAKAQNITPEELYDTYLDQTSEGCDGLMMQPLWGPVLKQPEARGAMIGFRDSHTKAHFYRAIIEGINYGLLHGLKAIEAKGKVKIEKLYVSGGGSKSDRVCQISADMFQRPVYRVQTHETSGLGSAIAGFVGIGVYASFEEAVEAMVHPQAPFLPNKEHALVYEELYQGVYRKMYRRLRPLYMRMYHYFK